MRKIKFKGKNIENEWVYGDLIHRDIWGTKSYIIRVQDSGFDNYDDFRIPSETVFQYTGENDKNNKEIYENDTLKVKLSRNGIYDEEIIKKVVFRNGCFGIDYDEHSFILLRDTRRVIKTEYISNIGEVPVEYENTVEILGE